MNAAAPRVAIIGAGLMGKWHLFTARRLGARIVAIVDPDPAAAHRLAERVPGALTFQSIGEMSNCASPASAHISTPSGRHYEAARDLLEAGVHVLVEKPMCQTLNEARHLIQLAHERDLAICPVHQYAFQGGMERALGWLGGLGVIRRIAFRICSAGADATPTRKQSVIADILPHPLSILQRLAPEISLEAMNWSTLSDSEGEFVAVAQTGDLIVSISVSMNIRPTCFLTRVETDGGVIEIDGFHGFATLDRRRSASRLSKAIGPFAHSGATFVAAAANLARRAVGYEPAYPGLRSLVRRFYLAAGIEAHPPPITSSQILASTEAWLRLRRNLPDVTP